MNSLRNEGLGRCHVFLALDVETTRGGLGFAGPINNSLTLRGFRPH